MTTLKKTLRIGTRKSPLALWQAEQVRQHLALKNPGGFDIVGIQTSGDRFLDQSLANIGGKGLFIKELEQALLDNRIDLAVHSMKDLPPEIAPGLTVCTFLKREQWADVLVSPYGHWNNLPPKAKVGTSSLRRQQQMLRLRPDCQFQAVRGNVQTRMEKLRAGEVQGLLLAKAGLIRLGLTNQIAAEFPPDNFLPALGQGTLGVQWRVDDKNIAALLEPWVDWETQTCWQVEREFLQCLLANCHSPVAGLARIVPVEELPPAKQKDLLHQAAEQGTDQPKQSGGLINQSALVLQAEVFAQNPTILCRASWCRRLSDLEQMGKTAAQQMHSQGAADILASWQTIR